MMAVDCTVEEIIEHFDLKPLPVEGGVFVQTYKSEEHIPVGVLPGRYPNVKRHFGTAILFLLTPAPDSFSALHWLPTDEIYHFYLGDPVEMLCLDPVGDAQRIYLGQDFRNGQHLQYVVPRGMIQGSHLYPGGRFALIGTTMAPGFDEKDYHSCDRKALTQKYPAEEKLIRQLTRPDKPLHMV